MKINSSGITYVGYETNTKQKKIAFKESKTYDYYGVQESVSKLIVKASSIDSHYNKFI